MSKTYGLSLFDLESAKKKIEAQKNYLEKNTFITDNGEFKNLFDVSFSANLSSRYYSRILNKVDTFTKTSMAQNLVPIFLTITLDGFFRDFLKGNYSRFTPEIREKYIKHIPNNDRNGHYLDMIDKSIVLRNKDLYKILSHQLHRFHRSSTLQKIRKDGDNYTSIRVTEPHGDGVPHFHILMYVPASSILLVKKEFERFFPAPQNHKIKKGGGFIEGNIRETNGFQTIIHNASGYVLKYILKSFVDVVEGKELDYLTAWYIHNKIPRLIATHTLVSQDVYLKCSVVETDWFYLTETRLEAYYKKDFDSDNFKFLDSNNRGITYKDGVIILSKDGKVIKKIGSYKKSQRVVRLRSLTFTTVKPYDFNFVIYDDYRIYTPFRLYRYFILSDARDGSYCFVGKKDECIFHFVTENPDFEDIEYKENFFNDYDVLIDTRDEFHLSFNSLDFSVDGYEQDRKDWLYHIFTKFENKSQKILSINQMSDLAIWEEYHNFDYSKEYARYALLHNTLVDRGYIKDFYKELNGFWF